MELETVTIEKAEKLLGSFDGNRPVRQTYVDRLCADIKSGAWKLNAQPIIISDKGRMIDGQHRCMAILGASKPIQSMVAYGVDEDAFTTIDSGIAKNMADTLHFMGLHWPRRLAASAMKVWEYKNGEKKDRPTRSQILDLVKTNSRLEDAVSACIKVPRKVISPANMASVYFLFQQKDKQLADDFLAVMAEGKLLPQPFHALRERLLAMVTMSGRMRHKLTMAFCIKAWNAARKNEKLGILKHSMGDEMPEIE